MTNAKASRAQAVKERISERLAQFLLSEKHVPKDVLISVTYEQTIARLRIDLSDIRELFEKA